jgi:hypothetical protein
MFLTLGVADNQARRGCASELRNSLSIKRYMTV